MKPRQRPSGRLVSSENREDLNKHSLAVCCFSWKACIETNIALADFKDKSRHSCKKHQQCQQQDQNLPKQKCHVKLYNIGSTCKTFQASKISVFKSSPTDLRQGCTVCTLTLCTTSIYLCDLALLVGNLWVVFDGHCIGRPVFVYKSRISLYAPTIASTGHTILCRRVIIIIKQPASRRALREVNRCCAAQFVHTSWPNSRQKAKLYPANTQRLQTFQPSCSQGFGENAVNRYPWLCTCMPKILQQRLLDILSSPCMLIFCATGWWELREVMTPHPLTATLASSRSGEGGSGWQPRLLSYHHTPSHSSIRGFLSYLHREILSQLIF